MGTELRLTESGNIYARARKSIPGISQTNSKRPPQFAPDAYPVYAAVGQGSHVWDVDGNEYVDWILGMGPISLGYRYPPVDRAIREQLDRGIIYGLLDPLEVEAAEELIDLIPCADSVRFLKGGGEATTAAARVARAFTGRDLVLTNGYHGWQDMWTSTANDGAVPDVFSETVRKFPYGDIEALESIFSAASRGVAAVLMCPAQKDMPPPDYLRAVRDLCDRNGALLIFDEVITGFRFFLGGAQEYFDVLPDLACFAKAMANGMPLAFFCGREEVMEVTRDLKITATYAGEALSLAATVACLREYRQNDVISHLWKIGQRLIDGTNSAAAETGCPARRSVFAPISYLEFQGESEEEESLMRTFMVREAAARGILFHHSGPTFICYSHTDDDVDLTLAVQREIFAEIERHRRAGTLSDAHAAAVSAPSGRSR